MIEPGKPKYRIAYRQCNKHEGEKLNLVCLNQKCFGHSLVCSMCREDVHKGHATQSLKFYLEDIRQQYDVEQVDYSRQFEQLQESRSSFLRKLRQTVQRVAEEFLKLEADMIERYETLRNQIIQNQSRRNKFAEFYQSLIKHNEDSPDFLIQNYLPTKQIRLIKNYDPVEELGIKIQTYVQETRNKFCSDFDQGPAVDNNVKFNQSLASSVTKVGPIYSQTNTIATCPTTLSAITVDLIKSLQTHQIKIRINKLKKGSLIHLGVIEKQLFKSLNHKAPAQWVSQANTGKLFFFNSQALMFGLSNSKLTKFCEKSQLKASMAGNIMTLSMKKTSGQFNLPNGGQYYFFFNLQGQAEIQITFLKK